jgi:hypothetical protein
MITKNRWLIVAAGMVMQVALGAVYSVERVPHPVIASPRLDFFEVTAGFEIAIFVLGLAASAGRL